MVGVVILELHLILPGVLSQLVLLERRSVPVWSENALIVANLAVEAKALRVCSLDVSRHIRLLAESLVAGVRQFFRIAWWRPPGAGISHSMVDIRLVPLHVSLPGEALTTVRARELARHLVDFLDVLLEMALLPKVGAASRTLEHFYPLVLGMDVTHHILLGTEHLLANVALLGNTPAFDITTLGETLGDLVLLVVLVVGEKF